MTEKLNGRYIQGKNDLEKNEIIAIIVMAGITPIISTIKYGLGLNFFEFDGGCCYFYSTKSYVKVSSAEISIEELRDITHKHRQEVFHGIAQKAIDGILAPPKSFHNFVCEVAREKQLPAYSNVLGTNVLLSVVAEEAAKRFEKYVKESYENSRNK